MSKPKEAPKIRVYVYEHLLSAVRKSFHPLAHQTDSEILNYLMTEKLSLINVPMPVMNPIAETSDNELVNPIDEDVD